MNDRDATNHSTMHSAAQSVSSLQVERPYTLIFPSSTFPLCCRILECFSNAKTKIKETTKDDLTLKLLLFQWFRVQDTVYTCHVVITQCILFPFSFITHFGKNSLLPWQW